MKILVTGAAGFIGSHLSDRLLGLGHEVVGVDNLATYYGLQMKQKSMALLKGRGMYFIHSDLRKSSDYRRFPTDFDYIFHLAAQPGLSSGTLFDEYLSNNVIATKLLTDFALGCKKLRLFVNISTSSVYGGDATKDESAVPEPISAYGITKLAAEQLVLACARSGQFNACSLRLYSVYGPRERTDKLYSRLIESAIHDKAFPLYEGSLIHSRSFTFVGDIVDGIVSVLGSKRDLNTQIFNIGSDQEYSTEEGIRIVERLLGTHIKIEQQPARTGDQAKTKAIISKAEDFLGYHPKTSLERGLAEQIAWQKQIIDHL